MTALPAINTKMPDVLCDLRFVFFQLSSNALPNPVDEIGEHRVLSKFSCARNLHRRSLVQSIPLGRIDAAQ